MEEQIQQGQHLGGDMGVGTGWGLTTEPPTGAEPSARVNRVLAMRIVRGELEGGGKGRSGRCDDRGGGGGRGGGESSVRLGLRDLERGGGAVGHEETVEETSAGRLRKGEDRGVVTTTSRKGIYGGL